MHKETVNIGTEYGTEYTGKYVFQELTWAKRSRIIQKHTKYHPITGQVVNSDLIAIQAETIWASLKEQPQNQPITLDKLLGEENGIPIALGEQLSKIANNLCAISREETTFLSAPSDDKTPIPQSQNLDFAKNSAGPQPNSKNNPPEQSTNSQSS